MKRRRVLSGIVAFGVPVFAASGLLAQSGAKTTVIGLLDAGDRREWWDVFRLKLRELGYVEGRDVRFEQRYAKGKLDALPALAQELVQLKVAVIVTSGSAAALAAEHASRKIPI